ncbi:MAG: Coenzyme F420 hydrogenase/dehydrogenase, beta subunit C-terminal domain [Bacteroidaceae bacterium]|nr:Coenzyme F420 hydrogenase/dehydrogenase, beta subunit C-terminal domain [Bacteroidaceae bacterium]
MTEFIEKHKCCGCSACMQACPKGCIAMREDKEGFLYPEVDKNQCIDCGLCEKVCPVLLAKEKQKSFKVYAAKNTDEQIRIKSSSGGIFTLLAEKTIEEKGVVFGARFDDNWEVVHDYTETKEGIAFFRGSKYVQSKIGETYKQAKEFLKNGRKVLFTGTPCQIAGLKSYLRKEYGNLLAVEVICHGAPSPQIWREYLAETRGWQKITGIDFRDKSYGWKSYWTYIKGENTDIVKEKFFNNAYMIGFLKNLYLRPSCYNCPFKISKSEADVTLGDFWGIENVMPQFDDDKGCSVVILHSPQYQELISATTHIETDLNSAIKGNPCLKGSVTEPANRDLFWFHYKKMGIKNAIRCINSNNLLMRAYRWIFRKIKK